MAVFAVSGSVAFLSMQAHNRLLSNFIKKIEFEIKHSAGLFNNFISFYFFIFVVVVFILLISFKFLIHYTLLGAVKDDHTKKKVRFADDVAAESTAGKSYGKRHLPRTSACDARNCGESLEAMPQNWQVMYKGILQYRNLRAQGVLCNFKFCVLSGGAPPWLVVERRRSTMNAFSGLWQLWLVLLDGCLIVVYNIVVVFCFFKQNIVVGLICIEEVLYFLELDQ